MLHTLIISVYTCMYISGQLDLDSTVCPFSFMKQYSCWQQSTYLEVIHQLFLYPPLYPVLRSCILLRPCLYHQSELCIPGTSQFYQWGIVLSQQGSSQFYLGWDRAVYTRNQSVLSLGDRVVYTRNQSVLSLGAELYIPGTSQFYHWGIELCTPGTNQFYHWGIDPDSIVSTREQSVLSLGDRYSYLYQGPDGFITGGQYCLNKGAVSFITGGQYCLNQGAVSFITEEHSFLNQGVVSFIIGDTVIYNRNQSILSLWAISGTSQFHHWGIHLSDHNLPISLMMGV